MSAASHLLANDWHFPLLNLFWTMLLLFLWVFWIFLLFRIVIDVFRSDDLSGLGKAGWTILLLFLPYLGVFIYVIARGTGMQRRDVGQMRAANQEMRADDRSASASASSAAGELTKLADLRDHGVLTDAEFQTQKAKLLG
jgi:hypothetical protein